MRKLYLNFQSQDSQHIECLVLCISTGWNFSLIISSCQPHAIHIRVCTIRRRRWMSNFISFISAAIVPNHLVFTNYASSSLPHTNNASSSLPHTNKPVVDIPNSTTQVCFTHGSNVVFLATVGIKLMTLHLADMLTT